MLEDFIPRDTHDRMLELFQQAVPEQNVGHYDGFTFVDDLLLDQVIIPILQGLLERMRRVSVFPGISGPKRPFGQTLAVGCTMVGYEPEGYIGRHIDSPLLSGDTVAVASFGAPTVLNLYKEGKTRACEVLVKPRSLYVMTDEARHHWSHDIKPGPKHFQGKPLPLARRYAVLFFEPGPRYDGELLEY